MTPDPIAKANAHKDCAPNILLQFKRRVTPACGSVSCSPTYGRYEPWNERTK